MATQIADIVNSQKRRRRSAFWAGFLAIALVGGLWAGLSKDPRGARFFDQFGGFEAEADFVDVAPRDFVETTVAFIDEPTTSAPELNDGEPAVSTTGPLLPDPSPSTTEPGEDDQ